MLTRKMAGPGELADRREWIGLTLLALLIAAARPGGAAAAPAGVSDSLQRPGTMTAGGFGALIKQELVRTVSFWPRRGPGAQEAGAYPVAVKWPVTSLAQPAGSSSQGPCPPGTS